MNTSTTSNEGSMQIIENQIVSAKTQRLQGNINKKSMEFIDFTSQNTKNQLCSMNN